MGKFIKRILFKVLFRKEIQKFKQEQKEISNQYAEFDFDNFYDRANQEDYTQEVKLRGDL